MLPSFMTSATRSAPHCPMQTLKPHYAKAATELKEYDPTLVIGKVRLGPDK